MAKTPLQLPFSGAELRRRRELCGLLQEQLAARCTANGHPVSRARISKLETKPDDMPSPPLLGALAAALGCEVADLLSEPVTAK